MRSLALFSPYAMLLLVLGCGSAVGPQGAPDDAGPPPDPAPAPGDAGAPGTPPVADASAEAAPPTDPVKQVFDAVDEPHLLDRLNELTGVTPVTVQGETYSITNRWAPGDKQNFRNYWLEYMQELGMATNTLTFPVSNLVGETTGHNVEAILPGSSPDSVVIIVHYDSVGITGKEALNPAADDDGSGLAMQMEAARIFAAASSRKYTVRFVAADYEEITDLAGDDAYAEYLQQDAQMNDFKILVAADDDQTGWSCWDENLCDTGAPAANTSFQLITCSGDAKGYDYPDLAKGFLAVAGSYSAMQPYDLCDGSGDTDHYSFWKIGVPAYVIEEYSSGNNPHFDDEGDDTMRHINLDYLFHTAEIAIAYQGELAGVTP